ncbi:ABC transporter permease subunit [Rhodosalinus sediminis]|uniref:ABC transporter permease subunit n=1 Tax=Rhodosalinus sediminis TaxID=1940533 RepID=A0A3D9BY21_9RHOB|nr:ABC transporter permease subunit [Rhodosalinus sediminis]REC58427.1 ABC transporter permease subunit [Rhodosalinus sediminis]
MRARALPAPAGRGARLRLLPAVPLLTVAVLTVPVGAGLLGTALPAIGVMPALGHAAPGLGPFRDLFAWPGLADALRLSAVTGLAATALALAVTVAILASWSETRAFGAIRRALAPLLSVPHAAAAFGLAFLIAPSGWAMRALSPWATGMERPPDWLVVQDPWGLALIAGLVAKEVPFLLLMSIAALGQTDARRAATVARSLGHGREAGWLRAVFPRLYAQIRLPVYVVLAYSMTVVDVAAILGPTTPPPLSVQIVRWMNDPDLALRLRAAAGAVVQLALVAAALGLWRAGEAGVAALGRAWVRSGRRGPRGRGPAALSLALAGLAAGVVLAGLGVLALWSVAAFWAFPDAAPEALTLRSWARHGPELARLLATTGAIAGLAALAALVLAVGCLEAETRYGLSIRRGGLWILYAPLLVPQVAFLPGLQGAFLTAGTTPGLVAVTAAHLVFVFPYVFLSLGDPWRAWDARLATVARSLGAGTGGVLWRVRLPMLLGPALTAFAVGFAVSVGQYLPTLLVGGGRVATVTTEAVALAAGGDRRAIGVHALAQTGAALLPFALALALPRLVWRNRRGMQDA